MATPARPPLTMEGYCVIVLQVVVYFVARPAIPGTDPCCRGHIHAGRERRECHRISPERPPLPQLYHGLAEKRNTWSTMAFPVTKIPFMSGWDINHHQDLPIESCQPSWSALRKSRSIMLRRRR